MMKRKTKLKIQNLVVIALFFAIVGFISYPIISGNHALLAKPAEELHLKVQKGNKEGTDSGDPQIIPPIFKEK